MAPTRLASRPVDFGRSLLPTYSCFDTAARCRLKASRWLRSLATRPCIGQYTHAALGHALRARDRAFMRHEHGRPTELTRRYGPGGVLLGLCVALSLGVLFQWLCIDGRVCKAGAQVWPWSLSGMQGVGSAAPHGLCPCRPSAPGCLRQRSLSMLRNPHLFGNIQPLEVPCKYRRMHSSLGMLCARAHTNSNARA